MTRHQRLVHRSHFEKLCFLRTVYSLRGPYDAVSCISLEEAIRAAEASLAQETPANLDASARPAGSVEHPIA